MRSLTAGMLAEIAKQITDPVFLIKAAFGGSTIIYATTREEITYDGDVYDLTGAGISFIDGTRLQFTLPNFDRNISGLVLADQIQGNDVEVFLNYNGETIARFVGLIDRPTISGDYNIVGFSCASAYSLQSKWPNDRLRPPAANHLPPAGTMIYIGPWKISLERDIG